MQDEKMILVYTRNELAAEGRMCFKTIGLQKIGSDDIHVRQSSGIQQTVPDKIVQWFGHHRRRLGADLGWEGKTFSRTKFSNDLF